MTAPSTVTAKFDIETDPIAYDTIKANVEQRLGQHAFVLGSRDNHGGKLLFVTREQGMLTCMEIKLALKQIKGIKKIRLNWDLA